MIKISTRDFERCRDNGVSVIVCTASCDPESNAKCKEYVDKISELEAQHRYINFYQYDDVIMDVDNCEKYEIDSIPCVMLFKNGELIKKIYDLDFKKFKNLLISKDDTYKK